MCSTLFQINFPPLLPHVALYPHHRVPGGHQQEQGGRDKCDQTRVPCWARCCVTHCPTAVAKLFTVFWAIAVCLALYEGWSLCRAAPACYLSLWKSEWNSSYFVKNIQYRILCLNCDLISDFKCRFIKSLNYNCPEHVMKFAEEVWTYFLGKFSDGLLGRHQKFFSHLPSTFHRNKVSHVYLFTNTWVVSGKTRLESSGLVTILGLVTLRMRKADQVPCCKKVKQFYLLVLCPMDKWSLTRLVRNYHPALMSGCEGRHLMTFVIFDCDCLPCLPLLMT